MQARAGDTVVIAPGVWQLQKTLVVGDGITLLARSGGLIDPITSSSDDPYHSLERLNQEYFEDTNKRTALFHSIPADHDHDGTSLVNDSVGQAQRFCAPTTWLDRPIQTLKDLGKVVLSCVSLGPARNGKEQSVKQIGTALSIQGAGVWVGGITIFGCANTAVNITGRDAYPQVCPRS
jgi:hypothetical protein